MGLMQYCPPNQTLTQFWVTNGMSVCFAETVISAFCLSFILLFGTIELVFYRRYATIVQHYQLPLSQLFGLQILLNGLMPVIGITRFLVEFLVFQPGVIYGYMILYLINAVLVWPIVILLILRERNYMLPTTPTRGHGLVLLIFWAVYFVSQNLILLNIGNRQWFFHFTTPRDIIEFSLFVTQYVAAALLFFLGLKAPGIPSIHHSESFTRLASIEESIVSSSGGGSPFRNFTRKVKMMLPFIWPRRSIKLQLYVLICVIALIGGRFANVYVPLYSKYIVDSLTINVTSGGNSTNTTGEFVVSYMDSHLAFRYDYVLIYVALKVIQGGGAGTSGLLSNLRSFLWISVSQYTTREVQVNFFGHLHSLSLRWHLQRKTGEVLRAMDRGTESVNNILNYLVFNIVPTVVDIIVAITYFTAYFNAWFGLIVFLTMLVYLAITFWITEWRTKFRRTMNTLDNAQRQQAIDSLLNFETVKYYANEKFEIDRYKGQIQQYQKEEWKVNASVCLLNLIQLFIINGGLLAGSLLCVKMVVNHEGLTAGDYVLFTAYLMQLYTPLNFFGTYYRVLQRSFIDMENMFDLFKQEAEIVDSPDAQPLQVRGGNIEFRNVSFNYVPEKQVLKSISFTVPAGKTLALVGPSGAGKSTIIRLLFRFYDPTSGDIFIDGKNLKDVTQESLRKAVGVVPQDTVLFNDTILYNIRYGRMDADDLEVVEASQAAQIHEKICSFPAQYETTVGERGLKLSGGEKQRVAIARTVLKNPTVILLDEATSALDTRTERQIQNSLQTLCQNRTCIIVAHRLSTVVNADTIIAMDGEGSIAEQGSHDELLARGGLYASMWNEQLKTDNNNGNNGENSKQEEE